MTNAASDGEIKLLEIMPIELPPTVGGVDALMPDGLTPEAVNELQKLQDDYIYWSDLKYKRTAGFADARAAWAAVKGLRRAGGIRLGDPFGLHFCPTNYMSRMCHVFDTRLLGGGVEAAVVPREHRLRFRLSSIIDEAISSSQMEGASTTRRVAEEMLRKELAPRDKSQRMIVNNYRTIRFLASIKDETLSPELVLQVHARMTEGTMDDEANSGAWRKNDEVVVADGITAEVGHTPPSYTTIPAAMKWLCDFANTEPPMFIHPIVKAIILHFFISYLHPFVDGNGRTARALFHWYLLREGYWMTEYLSVSRVIYRSKASYERAFLRSEADGNDMGYFITYHLRVLGQALEDLEAYVARKEREQNETNRLLRLGNLTPRQAEIVGMLLHDEDKIITVKDVSAHLLVTPTTAKHDITGLLARGFLAELSLNRQKKGYCRGANFGEVLEWSD